MKERYTVKSLLVLILIGFFSFCQSFIFAQISVTASGGTPSGLYTSVHAAFLEINAGTHTGSIVISVNGNTTEPTAPVYLAASGQLATFYTDILIKPTVVATIAGATTAGSAVINMDGADNVTIDGSISIGGTTRDLTIQNMAAASVGNVACIRLMGKTTLGLGATNIAIKNCHIIGSTPGSNGLSGSSVTTTYGIYAGSTSTTSMSATTGGANYDNLQIQNNSITKAYIGINIVGLNAPNQADNLQVYDNTIGSLTARIGLKGIVVDAVVGGVLSNNAITAIESIANITVMGVEVRGASSNIAINRNTITDIHQFAISGWGAYGIHINDGGNIVLSNNVIHGVQTLNYPGHVNYAAFGIRLSGGSNLKLYYNSVNMYGAYTTGSSVIGSSAALLITSFTSPIGLDIRNNVFANSMTSNASIVEFYAVYFPANFNFDYAIIDRNAYFVTQDAGHFVAKSGIGFGTGNFSTLADWNAFCQAANPIIDINSQPEVGNANAPFTSNTDLTIPPSTPTVMESVGIPIASLGLPNVDINNTLRPAGSGTNPDLGAYEFDGAPTGDLIAPVVSDIVTSPGVSCTNVTHEITANVSDNVAVTTVILSYAYNGVLQTPIPMTLTSGTALNGTYSGTIPATSGSNVTVTYSISALDSASNNSGNIAGSSYTDNYLVVTASADQTIDSGVGISIFATTNNPAFRRLLISEVVQFKAGTGQGIYPSYIPVADNDYIEITNFGDAPVDAGGYTLTIYGGVNGTFTIPSNTIIPASGTMILAFSGTISDPLSRFFGMNLAVTSASTPCGYVLRIPQGAISDAVGTFGYVFPVTSGVSSLDWSGSLPVSSGFAGVRRTGAADNNISTDWTLSAAGTNEMNIGVYNSQIATVPIPQTISWTNNFNLSSSMMNPLPVAPFTTYGVYTYTASFNDGNCIATDSVVITVSEPLQPVASFSATPIVGSAPLNVAFTDLSANLPTTWAWIISPMTGVSFTTGSSSSQNPVVQFADPGLYTVTLSVSNNVGSDDSTIVQYINVSMCETGAPLSVISEICSGQTVTLTATGANVKWYADATSTDVLATGILFTTPVLTEATSYFVTATDPGCIESARSEFLVTLNQATSSVQTVSACSNYTWPINESTYTSSGLYSTVIMNSAGCDSTITLELTILEATSSSQAISACNSYMWPVNGNTYTSSGEYTTLFSNVLGCDSIVTLDLTINNPTTGLDVQSACGTFTWIDGNTYTTSTNSATYTLTSALGCDSIVTLDLTIVSPTTGVDVQTACGSFIWIDGNTYTTSTNSANYTLISAAGCDSIVTLDLTIISPATGLDVQSACGTFTWIDGNTYTTSTNSATYTLTSAAGCDSIVTLDLTIISPTTSVDVQIACGSFTWIDGNTYTSSTNSATYTLTSAAGCDSIITLDLTIISPTTGVDIQIACGSFTWIDGNTYTTSTNTATYALTSAAGCDSLVTLVLTIDSVSYIEVTTSAGTLTANLLAGSNVSLSWLDCDNAFAPILGANGQSFTPVVNGNYALLVAENGCIDTSACFPIDNVGLNEFKIFAVSIVPNPTLNSVTVNFEGLPVALNILDLNGKVLSKSTIKSGDTIDLSKYENGLYIFNMYSESMQAIERVLKQ